MKHEVENYTFWGLFNNGVEVDTPITTLAYLVALVEDPQSEILSLDKAKFVLRYLFDAEEQVKSADDLLALQCSKDFPVGYSPQTPVMLTLRWSPISAMLGRGLSPVALARESKGMSCASGIWDSRAFSGLGPAEAHDTSELLFWSVLAQVKEKADKTGRWVSIVAKPGWSYRSNLERPANLTMAQAMEAGRVVWQRTPRPSKEMIA